MNFLTSIFGYVALVFACMCCRTRVRSIRSWMLPYTSQSITVQCKYACMLNGGVCVCMWWVAFGIICIWIEFDGNAFALVDVVVCVCSAHCFVVYIEQTYLNGGNKACALFRFLPFIFHLFSICMFALFIRWSFSRSLFLSDSSFISRTCSIYFLPLDSFCFRYNCQCFCLLASFTCVYLHIFTIFTTFKLFHITHNRRFETIKHKTHTHCRMFRRK